MALPVLAIPDTLLQRARKTVESMIRMSATLRLQAARAKSCRDTLLPKLVTGVIDVAHLDLDALLEEPAA
jgi:hypothetical protein